MKNFRKTVIICVCIAIYSSIVNAQIIPPGLGKEVNTVSWFALGLKQDLNKTVSSTTYIGHSSSSNSSNYNLYDHDALYVVNQEFSHHFKNHWKYSGAFRYSWQNFYETSNPYRKKESLSRQELRFYGRIYYLTKVNKVDLSFSYRPEYRLFYFSDFKPYKESAEFRSRFTGKVSAFINHQKTRKLIFGTELLFATDKTDKWSTWEYHDSRFTLYYSMLFPEQKCSFNIGYMNDLIGKKMSNNVHYLAVDLTFKNLF